MSGTDNAVVDPDGATILAKGKIAHWASGNVYDHSATAVATQGIINAPFKAPALLDGNGNIYGRSKPQYEGASADRLSPVEGRGLHRRRKDRRHRRTCRPS